MNDLPVDAPRPTRATAAPSLRRAIAWTAAGFAAMLVASIAACGGPVGDDSSPISASANASNDAAAH